MSLSELNETKSLDVTDHTTRTTTDHEVIRLWTADRGGLPACVAATSDGDDVGVLRILFPGNGSGGQLDQIAWEDFFRKFEEAKLAFIYEIHTADGSLSRFSKMVQR